MRTFSLKNLQSIFFNLETYIFTETIEKIFFKMIFCSSLVMNKNAYISFHFFYSSAKIFYPFAMSGVKAYRKIYYINIGFFPKARVRFPLRIIKMIAPPEEGKGDHFSFFCECRFF